MSPDVANPGVVEAFIDGIVIPQMKLQHSPSGVVTLVKDGQVIFSKGYGYQDIEKGIPVDPATTMFRVASISKLFTWIAVMQQVEQGNLDLDVDVNQYLKTFQIGDTWPGQPVTLRHILSHTAGFEDGELGYFIFHDADRIMPLAKSLATYIPERINPPGEHTGYSNWGAALAGLIVSNVSGIEFNKYIRKNIFDVLGMKYATFVDPLPSVLEPYRAKSYSWGAGKYIEKKSEILANFGPCGASAASAVEINKLARAILNDGELNGGRILKPETMQKMLTTLHSHDSRTRGMAYGFLTYPYTGIEVIGHDGGTSFFNSHLGISLENKLVLFASFSGPGAPNIRTALKDNFYDYFFPVNASSVARPTDFIKRADKYAGSYHPWRANFSTIEAIIYAFDGEKEVAPMADNTLLVGDTRFEEVDRNLFREVGGDRQIVFQENDKGEITDYISDGFAVIQMFRVPFYRTSTFATILIVTSLIVFLGVLLRRLYQGERYKLLPTRDKSAFRASLAVSVSNLMFFVLLMVLLLTATDLNHEVPSMLSVVLIFPIIALLATAYHLYQSTVVWRCRLGSSVWSRIRFSTVTLCGLMMVWLYGYWNFIGFNYYS